MMKGRIAEERAKLLEQLGEAGRAVSSCEAELLAAQQHKWAILGAVQLADLLLAEKDDTA